jgi:allophanate hydrolase
VGRRALSGHPRSAGIVAGSIHPVTREITAAGATADRGRHFCSLYRLQALRRTAERSFRQFDAMVLPTAPTAYTTAQVLANPIELNIRGSAPTPTLSIYSISAGWRSRPRCVPTAFRSASRCWRPRARRQLASIGRVFHADTS